MKIDIHFIIIYGIPVLIFSLIIVGAYMNYNFEVIKVNECKSVGYDKYNHDGTEYDGYYKCCKIVDNEEVCNYIIEKEAKKA
jgi:hypothetical protein